MILLFCKYLILYFFGIIVNDMADNIKSYIYNDIIVSKY